MQAARFAAALRGLAGAAVLVGLTALVAWPSFGSAQRLHPLNNDGSGGAVVLTFDDGPGPDTQALLKMLVRLHLHVIFFDLGQKVSEYPGLVREEVADGDLVENHSWNLPHFQSLSKADVRSQLQRTTVVIKEVIGKTPTEWKPPFGGYTDTDAALARNQGLELVPFIGFRGCMDSRDWTDIPTPQIVSNVTHGYYYGGYVPPLANGTLVTFHDGNGIYRFTGEANTIAALPAIVAYMNAHHLTATTKVKYSSCVRAANVVR